MIVSLYYYYTARQYCYIMCHTLLLLRIPGELQEHLFDI